MAKKRNKKNRVINDGETVTIPVTTPGLKAHGQPLTEIRLRTKVTAGDLRNIEDVNKPLGFLMDLAVPLSNLPPSVIKQLNSRDAMLLVREVGGFLQADGFQETGINW